MTLSGMTPAEQVAALGLAVGDTIEGTERGGRRVKLQLIGFVNARPFWEWWMMPVGVSHWLSMEETPSWPLESVSDWRKISSDPSIDPLTPLREELRALERQIREASELLEEYMMAADEKTIPRIVENQAQMWLRRNRDTVRNAAFGPGKGEGEG